VKKQSRFINTNSNSFTDQIASTIDKTQLNNTHKDGIMCNFNVFFYYY